MQLEILFDKITDKAHSDGSFRNRLLEAYEGGSPILSFCKVCNEAGIEIYPMDIADADESFYAAMRRSTNGGGENSPHLIWQEDVFESLINDLKAFAANDRL